MTPNNENPETVCEAVKNALREELSKELSFIRPEMIECIADAVCDKVSVVIEEKIAAGSLEGVEEQFLEASKQMGW